MNPHAPRHYHTHGLSVIPCGNPQDPKRPAAPWMHAKTAISQPPEASHYGVVCGAVSGNLECIDYDRKHDTTLDTYTAYRDLIQATHPYLWERLLLERSVNGGVHIIYRCPDIMIPGNQKLAALTPPNAVFETRGEGGYYICAPSPGYEIIQGAYNNIPVLTADERDLLINAARSFDTRTADTDQKEAADRAHLAGTMGYALSPFDDYDQRHDTLDLLKKHGWTVAYTRGQATYLTRPGKRMGVSATWNYVPNRLYVFTSSTDFDPDRTYKPCAVYAYLEHRRDFKAAAQALIRQGYGQRSDGQTRPRATVSDPDPEPVDTDYVFDCVFEGNLGDGKLAARLFDNTVVFDPGVGLWLIFDHPELKPGHWGTDPTPEGSLVMLMLQQHLTQAYTNALAQARTDEQDHTDAFNHAMQADPKGAERSRAYANTAKARIKALERRIAQLHDVPYARRVLAQLKSLALIRGNEWDANPMLLGVANGVVDLRTGTLRPAEPHDFVRRTAPTAYDPAATAPRWERFIHEIHGDDHDITDFMHRLLGYALTGHTTEHIYPILWGHEGRNGKDTLLDALHLVLGSEIAKPASKDTVITAGRRNTGAATPELYDLWGARLVWVNETEEADRLKAARLKELSGGSIIKCRPLHGNMVEFKPTHLGLLITNHKPHAPADDQALWERLVLIPYTQRFLATPDPTKPNERPVDKMLGLTLKSEAAGILTWLVGGCIKWQDEGLTVPDVLRAQTTAYRAELDSVRAWVDECVIMGDGAIRSSEAYKSYTQWCDDNGYFPVKQTRFALGLKGAGLVSHKHLPGLHVRGYTGGALRTNFYPRTDHFRN